MRVPVRDGSFFHAHSMSTGGETLQERPAFFEWQRVGTGEYARFYTDVYLKEAPFMPGPKVAVLMEAPPFRTAPYIFAEEHQDAFDTILTYRADLLEKYKDTGKWKFYPHCGSFIPLSKWGVAPKTGLVSMIASAKTGATGHRLRHEIAGLYGDRLDVLGTIRGEGQFVSKYDGHAPYRFSVVCCAERLNWGFSDHLIDCLSVGTVPIYWGCPEIGKFFDVRGILPFEKAEDVGEILPLLSDELYESMLPVVKKNIELAREYRKAEDWIWANRPELFEGCL